MKRVPLVAIVAAIGLVACKEIATAPSSTADLSTRFYSAASSNPPPPDVDTQAVGSSGGTTFTLNVRYFFNKPGNSGWLKFESNVPGATVDKNAQIRYSGGVFSGKGIVTVSGVTLDLTRVSQASQFSSCEAWGARTGGSDVVKTGDTAPSVGCFNLVIGKVTGGSDVYLTEKCASTQGVYDPRAVCRRNY